MPRWLGKGAGTEDLTKPVYHVERGGSIGGALRLAFILLAMVAAGYLGVYFYEQRSAAFVRLAELEAENARLREALTSTKLQSELELATRQELERQLAELNTRVKELNEELSFYKRAQSAKP